MPSCATSSRSAATAPASMVMMNAGLRDDIPNLNLTGADGIGLFRTEFQFLVSAAMPQRERQIRLYRDVLEAAGERPVIFRTVDIGGDKSLPYLRSEQLENDENPAMGWRALRLALEREGLLKVQARSLLEAAAGRTLNVMFPMVSEPWEFDAARAVFESQLGLPSASRRSCPTAIRYGVMLEVPALAEQLDLLLPKIAFLSIGTNDLTQFLFAADRANPKLAERYDWVSPAILRFLRRVVTGDRRASGATSAVCGEMGGRRLEALALARPRASGGCRSRRRRSARSRNWCARSTLEEIGEAMNGWLAAPPPDMRRALRRLGRRARNRGRMRVAMPLRALTLAPRRPFLCW